MSCEDCAIALEAERIMTECLIEQIRKCAALVDQRDEAVRRANALNELLLSNTGAVIAERKRCMAALCQHCADEKPAQQSYPGEWWHTLGMSHARCRASAIRSMDAECETGRVG